MTKPPLKIYRAIYRDKDQVERKLDLFARDTAHAHSQATYLIAPEAVLVRVYHNPDW